MNLNLTVRSGTPVYAKQTCDHTWAWGLGGIVPTSAFSPPFLLVGVCMLVTVKDTSLFQIWFKNRRWALMVSGLREGLAWFELQGEVAEARTTFGAGFQERVHVRGGSSPAAPPPSSGFHGAGAWSGLVTTAAEVSVRTFSPTLPASTSLVRRAAAASTPAPAPTSGRSRPRCTPAAWWAWRRCRVRARRFGHCLQLYSLTTTTAASQQSSRAAAIAAWGWKPPAPPRPSGATPPLATAARGADFAPPHSSPSYLMHAASSTWSAFFLPSAYLRRVWMFGLVFCSFVFVPE